MRREPLEYARRIVTPTPLPVRVMRIVALAIVLAVVVFWLLALMGITGS